MLCTLLKCLNLLWYDVASGQKTIFFTFHHNLYKMTIKWFIIEGMTLNKLINICLLVTLQPGSVFNTFLWQGEFP